MKICIFTLISSIHFESSSISFQKNIEFLPTHERYVLLMLLTRFWWWLIQNSLSWLSNFRYFPYHMKLRWLTRWSRISDWRLKVVQHELKVYKKTDRIVIIGTCWIINHFDYTSTWVKKWEKLFIEFLKWVNRK